MKHPHAELMLEYAKDAMETDKPWERWQYKTVLMETWADHSLNIAWHKECQYRRKPKPYEPTLLDQALELEIEAMKLRMQAMGNKNSLSDWAKFNDRVFELLKRRTPEMIEHLKSQGKL